MTKRAHLGFIFFITVLLFTGCEKSEPVLEAQKEPAKETPKEIFVGTPYAGTPIEGRWKLLKVVYPMVQKTYDYSIDNIVFQFNANASLEVNSNGKVNVGWKEGIHRFEFKTEPLYFMQYRVKIGMITWPANINATNMELNLSVLDGSINTFKRL
jgi:hypothetical protein